MWFGNIFRWTTKKKNLREKEKNRRQYENFEYFIRRDGTAVITAYTGEQEDLLIPGRIHGHPVTAIGEGAFSLKKSNMEMSRIYVTLPNSIVSIESYAFANREVFSVNIPDSVKEIAPGAFLGNDGISFRISNRHPYFATIHGSLYSKQEKKLLQWVKTDENADAVIPEGILSIGDFAFACMKLNGKKALQLPDSLKRIGQYAFWACVYQGKLVLPPNVTEIEAYAFADANISVSLAQCKGLWKIEERAFGRTNDEKYITSNPTILDMPDTICTIAPYAFYRCDKMPEHALDQLLSHVETIGAYAFSEINCKLNLDGENRGMTESIHIGDACKTIGECAFYNNNVTEITLGSRVESIASGAFLCCGYRGTIYLPRRLTYIAQDAFDREVSYVVEADTYAEKWVQENACAYTVNGEEENLDWLKA